MGIYTYGRLIEDLRTISADATSDWWGRKALQIAEESVLTFLSRELPFNSGEGVFASTIPYLTGTVAVTNGSNGITLTGGTWVTSWPTPAIARIDGSSGDSVMISAFNTATTGTLDVPWPWATAAAANYTIEFPAYVLPNYIQVTGVVQMRLTSITQRLAPARMEDLMWQRPWYPHSFWPGKYAIIPGNGTIPQKIFLWPPPSVEQTIRYRYQNAIPAFQVYNQGYATGITNTGTGVTGSGAPLPNWTVPGVGYSLVGSYFELVNQPAWQVQVAALVDATHITLAAGGYPGLAATDNPYCISPQIPVADDLKPLLRALVRWKYFEDAFPDRAQAAYARYRMLLDEALGRYTVAKDAAPIEPIETGVYNYGGPPPIPSVLRVE